MHVQLKLTLELPLADTIDVYNAAKVAMVSANNIENGDAIAIYDHAKVKA